MQNMNPFIILLMLHTRDRGYDDLVLVVLT